MRLVLNLAGQSISDALLGLGEPRHVSCLWIVSTEKHQHTCRGWVASILSDHESSDKMAVAPEPVDLRNFSRTVVRHNSWIADSEDHASVCRYTAQVLIPTGDRRSQSGGSLHIRKKIASTVIHIHGRCEKGIPKIRILDLLNTISCRRCPCDPVRSDFWLSWFRRS